MKGKLFNTVLVLVFVAGLSLLLYPVISNTYNAWLQSKTIVKYSQQVNQLKQETYKAQWKKATDYNAQLNQRDNPFVLPEEMEEQYLQTVDLSGMGIMAYIEIPSIDVTLPIAHGTSDAVLQKYVGHLSWSSLPVGGESTHCVLSGHRGLPSSELFTNIDHLEVGDKFYIHVLGQTMEYQVCHITVVEPSDQRHLAVVEGQDLVTLVTCTPYGINSHRLLVRGIRVGTEEHSDANTIYVKNEVTAVDPIVFAAGALAVVAVVTFLFLLKGHKKQTKEASRDETIEE